MTRLLARRRLLLDDPLYNLRLLDKESADDTRPHARSASRPAVRPADVLLGLGDSRVLAWAERRDPAELAAAVAALGRGRELFDVVVAEDAARGLDDASAVRRRVVRLALAEGDTLGHCGDLSWKKALRGFLLLRPAPRVLSISVS